MPTPEIIVENEIFDWLWTLEDCKAFKVYNGATKGVKKKGGVRKRPNGIPDIIGCYRGRFFCIEVKAPSKKPSKDQEIFMGDILNCGGVALWSDSLDKCIAAFNFQFGVMNNDALEVERLIF